MDPRAMLVGLMIVSMTAVFAAIYAKTGAIRIAAIIALIIGKNWALAIHVFGYDYPITTFYLVNRANPMIYKQITITACEVVALAYAGLLLGVLLWPYVVEQLPPEVRKDIKRMVSIE